MPLSPHTGGHFEEYNMSYRDHVALQQAQADQWLSEHKSDLSDVQGDQETYGQKKGYEVPIMDGDVAVADLVAEVERLKGEYYTETKQEDTAIEQGGIYNVQGVLACWQGKTVTDEYGKRSLPNGGFIADKYPAHVKKTAAKKARFGLEDFYHDNGTPRKVMRNRMEDAQKVELTLNNFLDDLTF